MDNLKHFVRVDLVPLTMCSPKEIPEVKSLRWLANMFPYVEHPKDETDKMNNAIHLYCSLGADKIEELSELLKRIQEASHA